MLLALMVLGLGFAARGIMLWNEASTGVFIQNWVTPASEIPRNSNMWTWGVASSPKLEPDLWHFHVFFIANDTADVVLLWNLNETVLFEKKTNQINETFEAQLPRTDKLWRWDWLIRNPNNSGLRIENFSVAHYPVSFPERRNGLIAAVLGVSMIVAASTVYVYFRRAHTRRRGRS